MPLSSKNIMKSSDKYDENWFQARALACLKKTDENSWDYTDSLLLYSSQGQDAYEVAHDEKSPYFQMVTKEEHLYLKSIVGNLANSLPNSFEYFDLGVGVENKETYFFEAFKEKDFSYNPVDVSEYFLSIAIKSANKKSIKVNAVRASFEELQQLLQKTDRPRFVSLIGLTFSNYEPQQILKLLLDIAGKNGYVFFDVQLRERVDIDELKNVYQKYVAPACIQKIKLLGLDPEEDISAITTDDSLAVWCSLLNVSENLKKKGLQNGDKLKIFQSLRPTMLSLKEQLQSFNYEIFDAENSFVGVLIKT